MSLRAARKVKYADSDLAGIAWRWQKIPRLSRLVLPLIVQVPQLSVAQSTFGVATLFVAGGWFSRICSRDKRSLLQSLLIS